MGKLLILVGNIVSDEMLFNHDLIVNPTNPRMVCGMGVSQAIFRKAGLEQLEAYTQNTFNISYFTENNLMTVGDVRFTPGFDLGMDILFVQGPRVFDYEDYWVAKRILLDVYQKLIDIAYEKGYKNVLCPSLGTGSYGFEHQDIAKDVISVLTNALKDKDMNIDFILYRDDEKEYYV